MCVCVCLCVCVFVHACLCACHSQVVHIAGIGHLLQVHAQGPRPTGMCVDDPVLNDVLEVGEAAPHVAQVVHGVRSGAWVPVPVTRYSYSSWNTTALS